MAFGLFTTGLAILFFFLIRSTAYSTDPGLITTAITADLLLTIPLIYLLLARRYHYSYRLVLPLFIAMIALGSWLLPREDRVVLNGIRTVAVPLIEIALLGFLALAVRKARNSFHAAASWDGTERIRTAAMEIVRHRIVATLLASELSMLYYLFRKPGGAVEAPPGSSSFGYHRNSPILAILGVLSLAVVIEIFAIHLLVGRWSLTAAWILTALGVYSLLFLIAHGRALVRKPHVITDSHLHVRNGLLWAVDIPLDRITAVQRGEAVGRDRGDTLNAVTLGSVNLTVTLDGKVDCTGIYGISKRCGTVRFHTDDPEALEAGLPCTKTTPTD